MWLNNGLRLQYGIKQNETKNILKYKLRSQHSLIESFSFGHIGPERK